MPKKKTNSDASRFTRYQSVLKALLSQHSFCKPEIYKLLGDQKPLFIGRVISDLTRDGYLVRSGLRTRPQYAWSAKKESLNPWRWIDQRVFTGSVKRSPPVDRPRERLLRLGPAALKISELLAILIRSGLPGESSIQAGEKLATHFGGDLEKLSQQARGELKQISRAIGETAYCQIMASLELGKKLAGQRAAGTSPRRKIHDTVDALDYCRDHFNRLAREATQEEFHVVLLDAKFNVIKTERITVGLLSESLAHPREVFKPAIRESASTLILLHNHPSGDPTPSLEDKKMTQVLNQAAETLGFRILDHIIVAKDKVISMVQEKLL